MIEFEYDMVHGVLQSVRSGDSLSTLKCTSNSEGEVVRIATCGKTCCRGDSAVAGFSPKWQEVGPDNIRQTRDRVHGRV